MIMKKMHESLNIEDCANVFLSEKYGLAPVLTGVKLVNTQVLFAGEAADFTPSSRPV